MKMRKEIRRINNGARREEGAAEYIITDCMRQNKFRHKRGGKRKEKEEKDRRSRWPSGCSRKQVEIERGIS